MTALRWPKQWQDAAVLELLTGSPVKYVIADAETRQTAGAILARAEAAGIKVLDESTAPAGVRIVEATWPGARLSVPNPTGEAAAAAGPTGEPWVDALGWVVQLHRARRPGDAIWIDSKPEGGIITADAYLRAVADAGANGGRWMVSIDDEFAKRLATRAADAVETWKKMMQACDYFDRNKAWDTYQRVAAFGVVSDFEGDNEYLTTEILNLATRNNQPCLVLEKSKAAGADLKALRAVVYVDETPPDPPLRRALLAYADSGGLLVVGPKWGAPEGTPSTRKHARFAFRSLGKGGLAIVTEDAPDPWNLAKDVPVLISHRYDVIRIFGANAAIVYYTVAPGGRAGLVQVVNFAGQPRGASGEVTVRIAAPYREALFRTLDEPAPKQVKIAVRQDATEIFLPPIPIYAAVELLK